MWQYVTAIASGATIGDWAILVFGISLLLYVAGTWNYDYFRRRGIPSTKPSYPFVGDMGAAFLGLISFPDLLIQQYEKSKGHGVFGMFEFSKPMYIVNEPELLKIITVKKFDSFMNHRAVQNENADPILTKNLFNLKDQYWRDMRATLSPAFTTSKIKGMFPLISECAHQMTQYLRQKYADSTEGNTDQSLPIEMRDLYSRLANDVIATAAFGVSCDSLKQPENEFYRMGKRLTTLSGLRIFIFILHLLFPKIMMSLGIRVMEPKSADFFDSLVHDTMRERQKKGILRPDMLHLLMQAREDQLKTEADDVSETEDVGAKTTKLSNEDLSAQAILFFFAGFDTVSSGLCLTTHLLSRNADVQKRLQEEISKMMENTGGKPTYETVQGMKYLDAVISEALRLFPPAPLTDRLCQEDTRLPASATSDPVTIHKGQIISIPIMGMHRDPQYWDEPDKFDPERFSDENKHKIKPFTYMPFGLGPRMCIGQRFALIELKLTLVHLLANFDLYPCAKTKEPLEFLPGFNLNIKGGFWCELKPRET